MTVMEVFNGLIFDSNGLPYVYVSPVIDLFFVAADAAAVVAEFHSISLRTSLAPSSMIASNVSFAFNKEEK